MKNNLEKNTSFQQDVFPRVAHHGHKNSYASKTEGAEKGSKLFEPALLPKKCMMNCSVFRTGLPAFHHLLTGWLPCSCCLMHLLKFPSCQRQGIPPHPIGASSGSNGISHQQRHVAAGANNQQNQGGLQQTRKWSADDLQPDVSFDLEIHSWKSMKELLLNMDLEQTGMRKSLDKKR